LGFSSTRANAEFLTFGLAKTGLLRPASTQGGDLSIVEQASDAALLALFRDDVEEAIGCLFRRSAKAIYVVGGLSICIQEMQFV
jgi:hypothetical protein